MNPCHVLFNRPIQVTNAEPKLIRLKYENLGLLTYIITFCQCNHVVINFKGSKPKKVPEKSVPKLK